MSFLVGEITSIYTFKGYAIVEVVFFQAQNKFSGAIFEMITNSYKVCGV